MRKKKKTSTDDVENVKKEIVEMEKKLHKERQQVLVMIMEREELLEKRERAVMEREGNLRELEMKIEKKREKLIEIAKKLKNKG